MFKVLMACLFVISLTGISQAKTVRTVYKADKSVVVIYPVKGSQRKGETDEVWLERVFTKAMVAMDLVGLDYDDVDSSTLPATREHRNAWEGEKGKSIKLNTVKKAEIDATKAIKTDKEKIKDLEDRLEALENATP